MTLFEPQIDDPSLYPRRERSRERHSRRRRIWGAVGVVLVAALLVVFAPWDPQRGQAISDQVAGWLSPAPPEIVALADATGMSETGRRIFFATSPELDDSASFNAHCPVDEQIVLGCYALGEIYLYRVTDERLAGTNEVTAAHEMLHAAYERLPGPDRAHVDALIAAYVATLPDDHPLFAVMANYPAAAHADEL